jgi:hypothetical protein
MLVLPARIRDESSTTVIEAEVLDETVAEEPVVVTAEGPDAATDAVVVDAVVVDAEVVDGEDVAQVTGPEADPDLPEGPRTSSD